jgi:outer membrane receptor protein involved in Fe transport
MKIQVLKSTTALVASLTFVASAAAQEAESTQESITVTGTRIEGLDLEGGVQAVQIDREAIEESGANSVIDLMRDLTITGGGSGTFSTSTAGPLSSDTPVGAGGVSLRGLGTSATLTLINGRRATISAFARGQESFIDVNSIPLAAIERVEVLPNGASATYGADAVAGVVNYVLRDDYEGQEISVSYGNSSADTDEGRFNINGIWGRQYGDHSVMAVVDYYRRNALFDRDREISRNSIRPSQQGIYPSFNDLFFMFYDQTEEPGEGGCAADDFGFGNFGEFCEVNTNAFVSTQDELESWGGLFTHRYQMSDRVEWFNELTYQTSTARGTGSPSNFSRAPIDPENPNWPTALIDDMVAEGAVPGFDWYYGYPIFAWGKLLDPRAVEVESETLRYVTGFDIELENGWNVETSLLYGRNERTQRGVSGLVNSANFDNALLGNLCSDGSTARRWDVDLTRPTADYFGDTCEDDGRTTLWYNPFGGQANQPAGLRELLETTAERRGESQLFAFDAIGSGELFEFNGNAVQAAFGVEFRKEELEDTPSGDAVATLDNPEPILGFSSTSATGERSQWAVFGELYIPVTSTFDVQLAGRYDEYDDFGGDFNPKIAFRWQPADSLIFRGNWSTSFRAPSLAQSGAGVLLSSYRVDCVETPAACDGDAAADGESLLSEDVGNPDLGAENAETWGVGTLFRPSENIEINLDYWNIRHEDLVGIDEDDFIRRALAGDFPVVAPGALATGVAGLEVQNGFVTDAHFQITNLGYQQTSGIDFNYTQYFEMPSGAELALLFDVTHLLEYERQASENAPVEALAGDFRYPETLANLRLRWTQDQWRASIGANHTSSYMDNPTPRVLAAAGLPDGAEVNVDSWSVFDANFSYDYSENGFIQLNIQNILDCEPPRVLGSSANVDHINHDTMGRFMTLRVTQSF